MAEHPKADHNFELLTTMADLVSRRCGFVLATIAETVGSTPTRTVSKALFAPEGILLSGWLREGCTESTMTPVSAEMGMEVVVNDRNAPAEIVSATVWLAG
jgi:xanthine/CO dehydrogenase XdhC/CoxF family maturation factor